jgi:MoaA/NifB/PqqE/SkfB family radical SAM enzyme
MKCHYCCYNSWENQGESEELTKEEKPRKLQGKKMNPNLKMEAVDPHLKE